MKLNRDYFYCFGCGATGDVIDFVARLFGLSSHEAAKKLAYDFGIDPDKPPAAMVLKKAYPLAQAFRNDEMHCQRVLCDYLHLLEHWKVEYAPHIYRFHTLFQFRKHKDIQQMIYIINHMTRFHKAVIWIILRHMLLKDGTIAALGQRLKRQEKEVQHRGEERAIA